MNEIANCFIGLYMWDFEDNAARGTIVVLLRHNYLALDNRGYLVWGPLSNIISGLLPEEITAGKEKGKLEAVKMVKNRMNDGLMNAKKLVEKCFEDNNLKFYQKPY